MKTRIFLIIALLFCTVLPAGARVTLGLVPETNALIRSEADALLFASYLREKLGGEEVRLRLFAEEKALHDWLNRFREVDLAILSRSYFEKHSGAELAHIADYLPGPGREERIGDPLVLRRGSGPELPGRLQRILLSAASDPGARQLLERLDIGGFALPGTVGTFRPVEPPGAAAVEPVPLPEPPAIYTDKKMKAEPSRKRPLPAQAPPPPAGVAGRSYAVESLGKGAYAAIVIPGGRATSNAFFVEGSSVVIAGGAHMSAGAIADLTAAVAEVTEKPIRYFILPHHHRGYTSVDFDFPPDWTIIMSWQTWQGLDGEARDAAYPIQFFKEALTLKDGKKTLILTNIERGHSEGDVLVAFPEAEILFTSDLLYVESVGYMGEGHFRDWALALEFMERLKVDKVIPGSGPVGTAREITEFSNFFKDFTTEVLKHLDAGESLEAALRTFALPKYSHYHGYERFLSHNVERAYLDLKKTLGK